MAKYDANAPISVWVGNLGKYNEGELVGEWFSMPCADFDEEWEELMEAIGIDGKRYEEASALPPYQSRCKVGGGAEDHRVWLGGRAEPHRRKTVGIKAGQGENTSTAESPCFSQYSARNIKRRA